MTTWGWGANVNGMLGVGDSTPHPHPTTVLGPVDFIASGASAGSNIGALFIATDRSVFYAGSNSKGGFGDGTAASGALRTTPTLVPGLSVILKVANGDACYALDSSGGLWGWGDQNFGQLAQPRSGSPQLTPILIQTGVIDFDSDGDSVIVLRSDGSVLTVGYNGNGRLATSVGLNDLNGVSTWQDVTPSGQVLQVIFGYACVMARLADGSVLAAGANTGGNSEPTNIAGQLGVTAAQDNPAFFALPYTGAIDIFGGYMNTFYRKVDDTIRGMGRNEHGNLGTGTATGGGITGPHESTPQQWANPFPVGVTLSQILHGKLGFAFSVLGTDGLVYTWGEGTDGEMGDGGASTTNPTAISINGLTAQRWVGGGGVNMWAGDAQSALVGSGLAVAGLGLSASPGTVIVRRGRSFGSVIG
jgi:hypothetical protein